MRLLEYKNEIKDTLWLTILQGLNYIAPLLVLPYLMVVLGADGYGKIGFAQSFCQYLMVIVDFGFNYTATKRIAIAAGNQKEVNTIFSSTIKAKTILLFGCTLIAIIVSFLPRYATYRGVIYVMFPMVIGQCYSFFWLFQGLGKVRVISIVNLIAKFAILPLTFIFVRDFNDVIVAAWIQSSVYVLTAIISIFIIYRKKMACYIPASKEELKYSFSDSFPLFISAAATSVYTALFVVILAYFSTEAIVGNYAAAEKIMRVACYLIWIPLSQAFFPKISRLCVENREKAIQLVNRLMLLVALVMSAIGVILIVSSSLIINFLGESYQNCEHLLKMMAFVPLIVGISACCGQFGLIAMGSDAQKQKFRNIYLIAGCIALLLVFPLSYFYEDEGTTIAMVMSEAIVCVMMIYSYVKMIKE